MAGPDFCAFKSGLFFVFVSIFQRFGKPGGGNIPNAQYARVEIRRVKACALFLLVFLAQGFKRFVPDGTAQEAGYIITDTDNLFLAFEAYRRAAAAAVDVNLHLGQFSYADAMTFLTQANGFEKEEAETIIKSVCV